MQTEILYEDRDLFVCYKPAGFAAQTASVTQADLVSELKNYRGKRGEPDYIGLIGRLDQPVEGLMVIAKSPQAARKLEAAQAAGRIDKYYLAVTQGLPKRTGSRQEEALSDPADRGQRADLSGLERGSDEGQTGKSGTSGSESYDEEKEKGKFDQGEEWIYLENNMIPPVRGRSARLVAVGGGGAKKARLEYRIINCMKTKDGRLLALLRIHLLTGRRHQIRLQLSGLGSPILGDSKYGADPNGRPLALCACRLAFLHPRTGERMEYEIVPRGLDFGRFKDFLVEML